MLDITSDPHDTSCRISRLDTSGVGSCFVVYLLRPLLHYSVHTHKSRQCLMRHELSQAPMHGLSTSERGRSPLEGYSRQMRPAPTAPWVVLRA